MIIPKECPTSSITNIVSKSHKSLYGLKQPPLIWYQWLVTHFVQQGFSQIESNVHIYVKKYILKEVSLFWEFIMWKMALFLAIIWSWHVWIKRKFEKKKIEIMNEGDLHNILGIKII
jgi:hypothetical protein